MADKSAFPTPERPRWAEDIEPMYRDAPQDGMTYKEWQWTMFAAAALQAASHPDCFEANKITANREGKTTEEVIAIVSCVSADAMMAVIAERESK